MIVEIKYEILHAHFPIFLHFDYFVVIPHLNVNLKNTNNLMLIVIFSKSQNKYKMCTVHL